jgi:hypothetical protein
LTRTVLAFEYDPERKWVSKREVWARLLQGCTIVSCPLGDDISGLCPEDLRKRVTSLPGWSLHTEIPHIAIEFRKQTISCFLGPDTVHNLHMLELRAPPLRARTKTQPLKSAIRASTRLKSLLVDPNLQKECYTSQFFTNFSLA